MPHHKSVLWMHILQCAYLWGMHIWLSLDPLSGVCMSFSYSCWWWQPCFFYSGVLVWGSVYVWVCFSSFSLHSFILCLVISGSFFLHPLPFFSFIPSSLYPLASPVHSFMPPSLHIMHPPTCVYICVYVCACKGACNLLASSLNPVITATFILSQTPLYS